MSLGTLDTAYPNLDPWFDLRPFLANGWRSLNSQTCGVYAAGNLLIWSMRLLGADSTNFIIATGIPENLRPAVNMPVSIITPVGSSFALIYRGNGSIALDAAGREPLGTWDRSGDLTLFGVIPRGPAV